jgi:hypothetical protein
MMSVIIGLALFAPPQRERMAALHAELAQLAPARRADDDGEGDWS